ncbi:hypothetical protein [Paenibacillus periandrae]|uniref:hypothetical protein n=1 Tax=Paenibacillus periandrae TaxID=1761741 RepID=UPI001F09C89F|nr:hypothetical protein [Paenibacillus periandrae]
MQTLVLANQLGLVECLPTYPVKVTSLFLTNLFDMNLNFSSRVKFTFSDGGTARLKDHLTHADLQLVFILFRCCNAYGYIELANRKAIYRRLEQEFEMPISESQFYVSLEKYIQHQLIVTEVSVDGHTRHKLNYFINEKTNKIGHYVLFHPFIFSKTFDELTLAEKKLIISSYTQTSGNPKKIISRNLKHIDGVFRHAQFSGLLSFLHKSQKSHISEILTNLMNLEVPVAPKQKANLFVNIGLVKGKLGYKAEMQFNPQFLLAVSEEEPQKYYHPLDACSLYPKFHALLKREADFYGIGELLVDRHMANRLVQTLRTINIRLIRNAFHELSNYFSKKGTLPRNPEYMIKECIESRFNELLNVVISKTGAEEFVRYPETMDELIKERKWSFSQAAAKSKLGIKKLRVLIEQSVHRLSDLYPVVPWTIEDYGRRNDFQYQELRGYLDIDGVRKEALRLNIDPYYYGSLEYNALLAIRNTNPKSVEEWMHGELLKLPVLAGQRIIPFNFRLEKFLFNETR